MTEKRYEPEYLCWKEKDFITDRVAMRMTPHQRLMYRALCQAAMFSDWRPNLPDDDNELYLLADADSLEHWKANRETVLAKFTPQEIDGVKVLVHKRLVADWQKHLEHIERKRTAGRARAKQAAAPGKHVLNCAEQIKEKKIKEEIKEKKTSGADSALLVVLPDWLPFEDWKEFLEMRKKIGQPATEYAKKLTIKDLDKLRAKGNSPKDVLQQSIKNNWRGVFELRQAANTDMGRLSDNLRLQRERQGILEA